MIHEEAWVSHLKGATCYVWAISRREFLLALSAAVLITLDVSCLGYKHGIWLGTKKAGCPVACLLLNSAAITLRAYTASVPNSFCSFILNQSITTEVWSLSEAHTGCCTWGQQWYVVIAHSIESTHVLNRLRRVQFAHKPLKCTLNGSWRFNLL